jgi:surface polysaccharide O-acyltransferase-like enzyme
MTAYKTSENAAPTEARFGVVEILRVVAAVGVIWFHVDGIPHPQIGYSGLIIFVILMAAFAAVSARRHAASAFVRARMLRLGVPWAFWFVAYLLANLAVGRQLLTSSSDLVSSVLAGSWIGLWYLPFAFVISVAIYWYARAASRVQSRFRLLGEVAVAVILLVCATLARRHTSLSAPWAQWLHALPAVFFGLAIRSALELPNPRGYLALIAIAPLPYLLVMGSSDLGVAICYSIALPLTALAFAFRLRVPQVVLVLSALTLGVYLMHAGILSVLQRVAPVQLSYYMLFGITTVAAFLATFAMRSVPWLRNFV